MKVIDRVLHYRIYKNEYATEWLTLVHGAGGSSSIWYKQIRSFREKFNVLLVDLKDTVDRRK